MSKKKKLTRGDIILLLLFVDGCNPIRGRTRLQKIVFIFEKEIKKQYGFNKLLESKASKGFEFKSHNYGPFSRNIFDLMDFFVNIELIKVEFDQNIEEALKSIDDEDIYCDDLRKIPDLEDEIKEYSDHRDYIYSLTRKGKAYVKDRLLHFLNDNQIEAITELKKTLTQYSLNDILKYVYHKYPQMAEESVIKRKVLEETWQS